MSFRTWLAAFGVVGLSFLLFAVREAYEENKRLKKMLEEMRKENYTVMNALKNSLKGAGK